MEPCMKCGRAEMANVTHACTAPIVPAHAIDVPSIMFGNGVDQGVVAERARVVKWLREQGRYSNLDDVADAIERGDHAANLRAMREETHDV